MANPLGERVWIMDADGGHYEYRTPSDKIRLNEEDKQRKLKNKQQIKVANWKRKQQKMADMIELKRAYKAGEIAATDANARLEEIKKM